MMPMTKPRLVLLDALYTNGEAFTGEDFGSSTRGEAAVDGVNDERPVHHLIAVEEVAVEDELESGILVVLGIVGITTSVELQL
jgi:hypothetical protein